MSRCRVTRFRPGSIIIAYDIAATSEKEETSVEDQRSPTLDPVVVKKTLIDDLEVTAAEAEQMEVVTSV
eukprot:gene14337-4218_t